jgi:hypothetical protein
VSSLHDLRDGLRRRAETISGLRTYAEMHPKPEPPAFCVNGPVRWTYDEAMGGDGERPWRPVFECWVLVNASDLYRAQEALDTYVAPSGQRSIAAAIDGDVTLGGVAHFARVIGGARPYTTVDTAGVPLLGFALEVEVTAV